MCHQIFYKLPCEHIREDIVYCADASMLETGGSSHSSSTSKRDGGKRHHSTKDGSRSRNSKSSSTQSSKRKACRNLTTQSIAYPMPPSFEGNPSSAALSPLLPKCPLPRCPFEARNRCWNCCWCGKGWNEQGRCSCIMIIEGSQVQCEHICCETCTAAGTM